MEEVALNNNNPDAAIFFKNILDGLSMGGIFVDKMRTIRYCNNAAENIFGYSGSELLGKKTDVIYGDRRKDKNDKNEIRNRLAERGYHIGDARGVRKDGRGVQLDLYTFIVKDGAGAAILIREAEKQAVNAALLLQDLMDNIPDMVYFKDLENRFVMVNKAHAAALGLSSGQILGKSDLDFFPAAIANKYFANDNTILHTGKPITDKIEAAARPDGGMTYVSTTKIPRFDRNGKVIGTMGITRNVTDRVTAEEEVRKYKDHLEELVGKRTAELEEERAKLLKAYNIKSDFIATVSHELRTPLTVMQCNIDIVSDGTAGPLNDKQKNFLGIAINNVGRLGRLINDILDLSKLEGGKVKYKIIKGNLNEMINSVVKSYETVAQKKGLKLYERLDPFLPLVDIDQDRVNQVLYNLMTNAMKFTQNGSITVESKKDGNRVMVTVEDTGGGIQTEEMHKLFERFEQIRAAGAPKAEGTGLGLAICKQIIEQLGGEIWAESEYGKGSRFIFTLPLKKGLEREK